MADTPTLHPGSSIRPHTRHTRRPPPLSCRDTVLSSSHRNRDSPEDTESLQSPAGHRSILGNTHHILYIIFQFYVNSEVERKKFHVNMDMRWVMRAADLYDS